MMNQISAKYIFNIFSGSTPESGQAFFWDGEHNWFTPDDLGKIGNKIYVNESNRKITDEGVENANLRFGKANSIIITKRAPIGNLAITTFPSSCNQGCFILEQKFSEINIKYYYYYFLIQKYQLNLLGRGSTFLELNADEMKSYKAPLPSLNQQNKIVDYLDNEVAKIDALIEKKTQLIFILDEKKKAVINQAVTKGLDPNVSRKDSGIEWLGDIPKHWEVVKLKYLSKGIETGSTPNGYDIPLNDDEDIYNWFTPGDFGEDYNKVYESKRKLSYEVVENSGIRLYDPNSVMFVGIGATLGKVAVTHAKFYTNQQLNIIELKDNVNKIFIAFSLSALINVSKMMANSATLPILNQQKLGDIQIPIPKLEEQNLLVEHLEKIFDNHSNVVSKISNSIKLLQEKRTAIISAAINGELNASIS